MADNEKKSIFPISGILLILAAFGFLQLTEIPFVGSRPKVSEVHEPTEMANARLWQEPFRAVLDYQSKITADGSKAGDSCKHRHYTGTKYDSLRDQINARSDGGEVTVLGVMVFGSPYAEETEDRLRRRYAVLTGLGQRNFVPDDPEHIGFVRTDDEPAEISMSNIMPFEWFSRSGGGAKNPTDSVLILWLNDNMFAGKPLSELNELIKLLGLKDENGFIDQAKFKVKVIGPAGSTRLQQMVAELGTFGNELTGLKIYSATATMDDSLLLASIDKEKAGPSANNSSGEIIRRFKERGITFTRTIASDRELAEKLLEELKLRDVVPNENSSGAKQKSGYIMLVSEWDTLYARSLRDIYKDVFTQKPQKGIAADSFIDLSYMRGIDGRLPGQKDENQPDKAKSDESSRLDIKHLERPLGESQYDYLRRLAGEAYEVEQLLQRQNDQRNDRAIRAIGVLGNDFYDKYLVLQALRQKFPDAVFFTTDLDARLLHPDNIEWTRNLIVASSFGFKCRDKEGAGEGTGPLSKKIPLSFRSNYQSSICAATFQALASDPSKDTEFWKTQKLPKIFEIGRNSAVELSVGLNSSNYVYNFKGLDEGLILGVKIFIIAVMVFILLYPSSHTFKTDVDTYRRAVKDGIEAFKQPNKADSKARWGFSLMIIAFAAFLIGFGGLALYVVHRPGEEPFSWTEGVSTWPTEILRLAAMALSFYYLFSSGVRLKKNSERITTDFRLGAAGEKDLKDLNTKQDNSQKGGFLDKLNYDWDMSKEARGSMLGLWREYLRRDSLKYRAFRLCLVCLIYVGLCGFIILAFKKPVTPVRGIWSPLVDTIALAGSVGFFIVLNCYVFDVTRTFQNFIRLAKPEAEWPPGSVQNFCGTQDCINDKALECWMLIRLIAIRTEALGKLIFYPFVILLIMFLARIKYFDNWHLPVGLALVIGLGAMYAWSSALVLRRSAEKARETTIKYLTKQLAGSCSSEADNNCSAKSIAFALDQVRSCRQGAFVPFSQHPVLQALLIPFGGVGGVYLFDFLAKLNI